MILHILLFVVNFAPVFADFQLCGKDSCTSWPYAFCPNATYPVSANHPEPGPNNGQLIGSLALCGAGFAQRFLCTTTTGYYRVCEGTASVAVGGVSGNLKVQRKLVTGAGYENVLVSQLKVGDEIYGYKGIERNPASCKVQALVNQGTSELAGMYSSSQLKYNSEVGLAVRGAKEPAILGVNSDTSFEVSTDCEVTWSHEDVYFSPISTLFCGQPIMDWSDYAALFSGISDVVAKTGVFWFDVASYRNCEASEGCKMTQWRDPLPRICQGVMECLRDKNKASCAALDTLTAEFVKEHVVAEKQGLFTSAYQAPKTLGTTLFEMTVPAMPYVAPPEKWYAKAKFWEWKIYWDSPWTWVVVGCTSLCLIATFFACLGCDCFTDDEGDSYNTGYKEMPQNVDEENSGSQVGDSW